MRHVITPRNTSFPIKPALLGFSSLLCLTVLGLAGCGDDEPTGCVLSSECGQGQVCIGGQCVDSSQSSCRSVDDCNAGEVCENNVCVPEPVDMGTDMAADAGTDTGPPPDTTPPEDTQPPQDIPPEVVEEPAEEAPAVAPTVASTVPADGASGVALDAVISITFDQPMRDTSVIPNVRVEDWRGNTISRLVGYDGPSMTVSLTPETAERNFQAASPYDVIVERNVRAENGLTMAQDFEMSFTTTGFQDALYPQLAEAYAPVVYQEVRPQDDDQLNNRIDWFTRADFDGDFDASNNLASAQEGDTPFPAVVYYNVIETRTHYLIQYVLYYPLAVDDRNDEFDDVVAHDFAYSLVVVAKVEGDALGELVLAEGLGDGQIWAFGVAGDGVSAEIGEMFLTFDGSLLEDGGGTARRYPMYVTEATHASCLTSDDGGIRTTGGNRCIHDTGAGGPFDSENRDWSRILRAGDGDNWTPDAEGASSQLTYELLPFLDTFWVQRGNDAFYQSAGDYNTPTDACEADDIIPVPGRLTSASGTTGDLTNPSRRAPFLVQPDLFRTCCGCSESGIGTWFVDPAFELLAHVSFDGGFSTAYCFNPFRGIDERDSAECE